MLTYLRLDFLITNQTTKFEYTSVLRRVCRGSFLIATDVKLKKAFEDFPFRESRSA